MARRLGKRRKSSVTKSTVPIVGIDYWFITKEGFKRRDELTGEIGEEGNKVVAAARTVGTIVKCLLVRCVGYKHVISHVVPREGDDEEHFCEKLEGLKLNGSATLRFIIKTANGRSFVSLKVRVA